MSEHQNKQPKNDTPLSQLSQERATKSNAIEIPSISLPKGGGAIKGIDEKFQVNAANGTASFSIPLPLSPNRNGFTPQLSLSYNSGVGNGLFGIGWDIDLPSIQRRTDKKLPRYFDSNDVEKIATEDSFMFSGVEELVPYLNYAEIDKNGNPIANEQDKWKVKQEVKGDFTIRQYRPRIEGAFSRIERIFEKSQNNAANIEEDKNKYYWKVTSKDNITTFFGYSKSCRIADPNDDKKVFQWLPEFAYDDKGSWVWYEYKEENLDGVTNDVSEKNRYENIAKFSNKHIKRIRYGNETAKYFENSLYKPDLPDKGIINFFELVFDYGEHFQSKENEKYKFSFEETKQWASRKDAFSSYRSCFEMRTYRLCQRVLMFHNFTELKGKTLIRSINFEYSKSNIYSNKDKKEDEKVTINDEITYLVSIEQTGYIKNIGKSLPKMTFQYQELTWKKQVENVSNEYQYDFKNVSSENLIHAPTGLSGNYQWTDLYNEGINGILTEQANAWFYKSNFGQVQRESDELGELHFSQAQLVMPKPSFSGLSNGTLQLQDLDANGEKQLVVNSGGIQGYFELTDDGEWQPFRAFLKNLNLDLKNPNVRMLDVNGDGKPEVVLSDEGAFWFWENEGKIGYDAPELATKPYDEEHGAAIVFADQEQRIFLADMSGDGMTDIVRIRNGEVCYWANMGYGRFAPKVTMRNSPVFDHSNLFNPSYIQLADISGTGATDIIYLGKNVFKAYLNCSGNAWTSGETIEPFFPTEHPNRITVTDLLGNGTACIVWSSEMPAYSHAPMRYIDLMGGKKPHIMKSHENGMGKTTTVEYKSSTYFYLKDKLAGTPWITKLGFPVQVVAKTIVTDSVTNVRFSAQYSYHHGYYDHAEREFRGFGRVEQWDTEEFSVTDFSNQQLAEHYQPSVLTKTWFHTGAFIRQDKILTQFEKEYWKSKDNNNFLEDAYIENDKTLSASEYREAVRACKGMTLRQEVFAEKEAVPYSVATYTCFIRQIQPKANQKYAVLMALESEAITFTYEKKEADVRIAHSMNLEINQYAQVEKAVSIVYGRKKGSKYDLSDYGLINDFTNYLNDAQQKTHIILTETDFTIDDLTDKVSFYRLPLPYQVKTFECQGIAVPEKQEPFYSLKEIKDWVKEADELPYEDKKSDGKRLIEHIKTIYRKNDLSAALGSGELESLALPYESYQLAFTPSLLGILYDKKLKLSIAEWDKILIQNPQNPQNGRYEKIDAQNYWISSGKPLFTEKGKTEEEIKAKFYLPVGYEDPFENKTEVEHDTRSLFMEKARVYVDKNVNIFHETKVLRFNYRTLSPDIMQDINDNISSVIVDELGLVKATAIEGKDRNNDKQGDEADNLNLFKEETDENETILITTFFKTAKGIPPKVYDYNQLQDLAWQLLGSASARMVYDFSMQPTVAASIIREEHANVKIKSPLQISFEYTDGFGKVALKKIQAEPEVGSAAIRWIGNGRTVLNNKGNPIKQYEPYFSTTPDYEKEDDAFRNQGVTPILYYDALGRNTKTELPDGTFTKVEFDAWEQRNFDQNNNKVGHKDENTPSILYLDSLGRPFFSIADNGVQKYPTYVSLDIEGNAHKIVDARNNTVMEYKYDMLGHRLYQNSAEAGDRWMLNDCMGKPMLVWDSKGNQFETKYDTLHRPVKTILTDLQGVTHDIEVINYDSATNGKGQIHTHKDGSGQTTFVAYDFKGNVLEGKKQFLIDHKITANWNNANLLNAEIWTTETKYDALNRPFEKTEPYSSIHDIGKSIVTHTFNKSGQLKSVSHNQKGAIVKEISYNPKGQRLSIAYGNQTKTIYIYNDKTFRLATMKTANNSSSNNAIHQDLEYTYDPVGNIISIKDISQDTIFFRNQQVKPENIYEYDALYRLVSAKGREQAHSAPQPKDAVWTIAPSFPVTGITLQIYTQTYIYDEVGNIKEMRHIAATNSWTRTYKYEKDSNRLQSTETDNPIDSVTYRYDKHGNILNTHNTSQNLSTWDYRDMIQQYDLGGGGMAYYEYDSQKQRTRKVITNRNGKIKEERLYFGTYEVYREYNNGDIDLERVTQHIMDDTQRVAMIETRTKGNDPHDLTLLRYIYANHLGSSTLELNENATVISYEEYHPYGTTAYHAQSATIKAVAKRYRYTGMERDEETGFAYHTARYYLPWLGRWASADPIGVKGGLNLYEYAENKPIILIDKNGQNGIRPDDIISETTAPAGDRFFFHVLDWRGQVPELPGYSAVGNQMAYIEQEGFLSTKSGASGQFGSGVYAFASEIEAQGLADGMNRPYAVFKVDPDTPVRTINVGLINGGTATYNIVAPNTTENLKTTSIEFRSASEQQLANYNERKASIAAQLDSKKPLSPVPEKISPSKTQNASPNQGVGLESGFVRGTTSTVGRAVPFVAEIETALIGSAMLAAKSTVTEQLVVPLLKTAEVLPAAAGVGVIGAATGHAVRWSAEKLGESKETANVLGLGTAVATGAVLGSFIPIVGSAAGALIGAAVAGGFYLWSQ